MSSAPDCEETRSPPDNAVVLRFPPGGPNEVRKIRQEAKYAHRHHQKVKSEPWYRLSVWADVARPGESRLDLMNRLIRAAGLGGIRLEEERNTTFWWSEAGRIYAAGFTLEKDDFPGEPLEHYSVNLGGEEPTRETVESFAAVFEGPELMEGIR